MSAIAVATLSSVFSGATQAQQPANADDIAAGRVLSLRICTACHVVSPNQEIAPILHPPAPSFASIANRSGMTEETVRHFLANTHRSIGNTKDMPNPSLMDDQIRQAAAYLMSLHTKP
ncbi:MAG TPA: c-type cytochrome [Stellaceae bacterium]|nr:c-type cytochrome [Stellaceae bacterium]